jgi:signal transduction histidine kinase
MVTIEKTANMDDAEHYRRESLGAFAHEIRTPLTSIKMVMELARRQAKDGQLVLDTELADMLRTCVDDLQALADDLQETSRLERGRLTLATGPCDLGTAIAAAQELLDGQPRLALESEGTVEGPWDAPRLVRTIAGLAESANRLGDGSGRVLLTWELDGDAAVLTFRSGEPGGEPRAIGADAGFSFFRSRQLVLAMGGSLHCTRAGRNATFQVVLPLRLTGGGSRG